MQHN